jgi:hypothetical protein
MILAACATAISVCVAVWAWQGDQTGRIASHLTLYGAAFAAYLLALHASRGLAARRLRLALGLAVLWRAALVLAPPLLSDDVYRSVWEGRIQLHGGNPFAWEDRPESPRWLGLRDDVFERLNHKGYTAIYPPLWQLAARAVVSIADSVTLMKTFLVGCELVCLWVLGRILEGRGLPPERLLVQAWSPLALVEIAGSGHHEALGMLGLVVSLALLDRGTSALSALAAALGAQSKLLPGLVAAAWARRFRARDVVAGLAAVAIPALPFVGAGRGLVMSLGKYAEYWRFNETLFATAALLTGSHGRAVALVVIVLALLVGCLAWRRSEPATAALTVVIAILVLSPNVLPWYALWLLPLLVLRDFPPALLFSGTVGLSYLVYPLWQSGEPWRIGWGIRLLEYGPCLATGGLLAARAFVARARSA